MFGAWTAFASIALVTSLNSKVCSPARAATGEAKRVAALIRVPRHLCTCVRDMRVPPFAPALVNCVPAQSNILQFFAPDKRGAEGPSGRRCEDWTRRKELLFPDAGIVVWDRRIPPDTRLAGSTPCLIVGVHRDQHFALDLAALIRGVSGASCSGRSLII